MDDAIEAGRAALRCHAVVEGSSLCSCGYSDGWGILHTRQRHLVSEVLAAALSVLRGASGASLIDVFLAATDDLPDDVGAGIDAVLAAVRADPETLGLQQDR